MVSAAPTPPPGAPVGPGAPIVNRRKSELPPRISKEFAAEVAELARQAAAEAARKEAGIVCSNSDLLHLIGSPSSETSVAGSDTTPPGVPASAAPPAAKAAAAARGSLGSLRGDSTEAKEGHAAHAAHAAHAIVVHVRGDKALSSLAAPPQPPGVRPAPDGVDCSTLPMAAGPSTSTAMERRDSEKVLWDERSGSIVDASLLGSAIEGFLNKAAIAKGKKGAANSVHRATAQLSAWVTAVAIWTPRSATQSPQTATPQSTPQPTPQPTPQSTPRRRSKMSCDAVCSTLKSLFVK